MSQSGSSEDELAPTFTTEEAANKAATEALALSQQRNYAAAAQLQNQVVAFLARKYGDFHIKAARAYLRYGQFLLGAMQTADPEKAALAGLTEEGEDKEDEVQYCSEILQCARLGLEKEEKVHPDDEAVLDSLVDVHCATGALAEEAEMEEAAIKEYEFMLALSRDRKQPKVNDIVSALYYIGLVHAKALRYKDALPFFNQALEAAKGKEVAADFVEEIRQNRDEAVEVEKAGGPQYLNGIMEEIRGNYPAEESLVTDPAETLQEAATASAFVAPLPLDLRGDRTLSRSIPAALAVAIPPRESSASVSHIQPCAGGVVTNRPVNQVVARKKPKSEENSISIQRALSDLSQPAPPGDREPATKKARTEH